jgi:predicted Zn-dependent peptidase
MNIFSIRKHILKNGLIVLYCHTPETVAFELAIHINTGSRDENDSNSGVSHFLEHMMFRGSRKYPNSISLSHALESFGGETNAMTGIEHTTYWLKGDSEKTLKAIECFADFFLYPNFADLEIERSVILQEMASDFNESGDSIDTESLSYSTLFSNHPLGNSIIGNEEVIKKLTTEELHQKRKDFYIPSRCIITLHTSISEEEVIKEIDQHFGHKWEHSENANPQRVSGEDLISNLHLNGFKKPQNALCLQNNPDNQFATKIIFPTIGGLSKDVILVTFLQRILDDGICTRLPANIREKHGLVYDISCDTQFFYEVGTFSIDATVSEDLINTLLDKLTLEIISISNEAPSFNEVEHIKFRYIFDLKQIKETPSRLLNREVIATFMNSSITIDDEIEFLKTVTPEMVLNIAKRIFSSSKRGLVLVGPKSRKKRDYIESLLKKFDKIG